MSEVLISVNKVKLNKEADGLWLTTTASANATGKQGAKRPTTSTSTTSPPATTIDPSITIYLYKTSELSQKEVKQLIKRSLCPLCRRNSHPLNNCYALKSTYNISLKSSPSTSTIPSTSDVPKSTQPTSTANTKRVTNLPMSIVDEPER